MRQVIELNSGEKKKFKGLTEEMINTLGAMLNTREMAGIEMVYFTQDSNYWFNAYPYEGQDKQFKGKKYARFGYQQREVTSAIGERKWVRSSHPLEEFEIVASFEAEEIVNKYISLNKKK